MRAFLFGLLLFSGCGGDPVLRNAPRPNTAAVAGAAAGIAGAATLVDPNGQAARVEEAHRTEQQPREQKHGPSVPADVLDRLDEKKSDGSDAKPSDTEVAKPNTQPAQPAQAKKKGKQPDLWQPPDCDHEPLSKRCAK